MWILIDLYYWRMAAEAALWSTGISKKWLDVFSLLLEVNSFVCWPLLFSLDIDSNCIPLDENSSSMTMTISSSTSVLSRAVSLAC